MLKALLSSIFDDPDWSEAAPEALSGNVVSALLPYRIYDGESDLYYNDGSTGFLLEIHPVIGEEDIAANLHAVLTSHAPSGATIQILNWTSPDVDPPLVNWARHRMAGDPLVREMAANRIAHIRSMRFGNDHIVKAVPHRRRVFIAAWIDGEGTLADEKNLKAFRRALQGVFGGDRHCVIVRPGELLKVLGEWFHARDPAGEDATCYSPDEAINNQLPGVALSVHRGAITLLGEPQLSVASATVRRYPKEWRFILGSMLNGVPERIHDRAHGPVLTSLSVRIRPATESAGFMTRKRAGVQHTASTQFARFSPNLKEKMDEFERLNGEVENGERLTDAVYVVSSYAKGGVEEARHSLAELGKIYRYSGLALENDTFIQLPVFLAGLPFTQTGSRLADLKKLQRVKIIKAAAATAMAPVHGEWTGTGEGRGVLLLGRQGGVFDWDNFKSTGNYNVAVVGKSGAGKSVFMQELVTSIYACGGKVVVIDDGYSFRNTVEILGGSFIAFDGEREIKLNPFSMLVASEMEQEHYRSETIELLTGIIASMAALGSTATGRVEQLEEGYIAQVVGEVWDAKGRDGEITDVWERIVAMQDSDERLRDVAIKLEAFTSTGRYGSYFTGPANLTLDSAFTVFELSNIKGQKALQDVVLQIIMFLGTELMYKTDRSVPVVILIDEAWDLLHGPGTARFIGGVVRRARKYTGALITGTQSIDDYYANPAAEVCLQNSDWTVFLAQKAETIDRLVANDKLSVSGYLATQIKSLTSVPGLFSEMAIKGAGGWVFGRLMLDPFSLAVFSSKGATVERIRKLKAEGRTTVEAIREFVAKGGVE